MQREMFELTDEVLLVPIASFLGDPNKEWDRIVLLHLIRAHQTLGAVRITSAEEWYAPSVVLIRYLFELAANLIYLDRDIEERVPAYLEHCRCVSDLGEADKVTSQLDALWEQGNYTGIANLLLPGTAWKPLKQMCEEIGFLDQYNTMYRHASEAANGGAHGMAIELLEHLGTGRRPEWEIPGVLITALTYYGCVVEIACKTFEKLAASYQFGATWGERIEKIKEALKEQIRRES